MLVSYRAVVIGDTATYNVTRFGSRWTCNCAWGMRNSVRPCSHILAVQAATPTNQAPVAALAAVINDGLAKRAQDAQARHEADFNSLGSATLTFGNGEWVTPPARWQGRYPGSFPSSAGFAIGPGPGGPDDELVGQGAGQRRGKSQ